MHVIAAAGELEHNALAHAVALLPLQEAAARQRSSQGLQLPEGTGRLVISADGTESEAEIAAIPVGCLKLSSTWYAGRGKAVAMQAAL